MPAKFRTTELYFAVFVAKNGFNDWFEALKIVRKILRKKYGEAVYEIEIRDLKRILNKDNVLDTALEFLGENFSNISKESVNYPNTWSENPSQPHLLRAILENHSRSFGLFNLTENVKLSLMNYGYTEVNDVNLELISSIITKNKIHIAGIEPVAKKQNPPARFLHPKKKRLEEQVLATFLEKSLMSSEDWEQLIPKINGLIVENHYELSEFPTKELIKLVAGRFGINIESAFQNNRARINRNKLGQYKIDYSEKWINGGSLSDGQNFESWGQLTKVCQDFLISNPEATLHFGTKDGKSLASIFKGYFLVYIASKSEDVKNPFLPLENIDNVNLDLINSLNKCIQVGISKSWIEIPRSLIFLLRHNHVELAPSDILLRIGQVSEKYLESEIESLEKRGSSSGLRIANATKGYCVICGSGLSDALSLERGVGPDCWKKLTPDQQYVVQRIYDFRVSVEEASPSKMLENIHIKRQFTLSIRTLLGFYPN